MHASIHIYLFFFELTYHCSNEAQRKYSELHHKVEAFMQHVDEAKKNPESKYDALIYKQNCVNDTVAAQVST